MQSTSSVVFGTLALNPAPVWSEPHKSPDKHLFGCINKWKQLTRITQYDKLPAFDIAINILESWSEDSRLSKEAMLALWSSPKHSSLMTAIHQLTQAQINAIQGQSRTYASSSPPANIPWNDGNWAPLPDDLVKQLQAQEQALIQAKNL
jgi:hypothetical protein